MTEPPVLVASRYRRRLSRLAIALLSLAVVLAGFGRDSGVGGGGGIVVSTFSVTNDLSIANVGLINARGVTFVGPQGSTAADGGGVLRIPLDFGTATVPTTITLSIVGQPDDVLQVNYYPAQYYRSVGVTSAGVIDLYTTLPRSNNSARKENLSPPAKASPTADQTGWDEVRVRDGFPAADASLDDQIRQLYLRFDEVNDPEAGTICARMSGLDTYSAISLNSCYVTCTGYAVITDAFLGSLETPARYISLGGPYTYLPDGVLVESSESHDTTDMWANGTWQWLDPTLRVLRATGPGGSTLTLDVLMQALSDKFTRDQLSFTRLDPVTEQWTTLSWANEDAAFREYLSAYLSADKIMFAG
jgi:hypothetical protein